MTVTLERHLGPDALRTALEHDVRRGLTASPKTLPPKWFYDARGSELFDQITRLPEYYPTRREREILHAHAAEIAACGADTLVEIGSGTSEKTRTLLDALRDAGTLRRFVPLDVDEWVLSMAAKQVCDDYPGVDVHAIVGDFEQHLPLLPAGGHRLVAFLGGTIGNLEPAARAVFLADLADTLTPGEALLLGTDLVKAPDRLVPAYDDAQGVTAEFNLNVLRVINRELEADFDPARFRHVALWDAEQAWIEMRLESVGEQVVHLRALDLEIRFAAGEQVRTEISAKFTQERIGAEILAAGFSTDRFWTDAQGDFGLTLAVRS